MSGSFGYPKSFANTDPQNSEDFSFLIFFFWGGGGGNAGAIPFNFHPASPIKYMYYL